MPKSPKNYYDDLTYNRARPFASARSKLKRAKRHLIEVENAARRLPQRQPYQFLVGRRQETGQIELICMTERQMPMEFAATVGDAIHNLRCTFDHVAVALTAPPLGIGNAADAYFPTGKNRQAFLIARDGGRTSNGKRRKGKMEGASPDALRMVEELEPYDGGKHCLRALHDLDILDKHKLIVPTLPRMTVNKLMVSFGKKRFSLGVTDFKPNDDGSNLNALIDCPTDRVEDLNIDGDFRPTFEIVFGKDQPLGGQPVVGSLANLANTAERFIEACEGRFLNEPL